MILKFPGNESNIAASELMCVLCSGAVSTNYISSNLSKIFGHLSLPKENQRNLSNGMLLDVPDWVLPILRNPVTWNKLRQMLFVAACVMERIGESFILLVDTWKGLKVSIHFFRIVTKNLNPNVALAVPKRLVKNLILFQSFQRCRAVMVDEFVPDTTVLESSVWDCPFPKPTPESPLAICGKKMMRRQIRKHIKAQHKDMYKANVKCTNNPELETKLWLQFKEQHGIPSGHEPRTCKYCNTRIAGTTVEHLFGYVNNSAFT